jgi:hypothetical protein
MRTMICNKEVYRVSGELKQVVSSPIPEDWPDLRRIMGNNPHKHPSHLFMKSFLCPCKDNSIDKIPTRTLGSKQHCLMREEVVPMHNDDRSALLAWVQAKQKQEK